MKKLRDNLAFLGLEPRKECIFFGMYSLLFVAAFVLVWLWNGLGYFLIFPTVGYLCFAYFYYARYAMAVNAKLEKRNTEFVNLFTFCGIYIGDGFSVYNALEKVRDFASDDLSPVLERLLLDIDEDKSVTPYVTFASYFRDVAVKEVMLSVYQMVDEGQGGVYIRQFQKLFGRLSDTKHQLENQRRLNRLDTLSFLPLAGSGIAMLTLTLSIMEVMGGLTDVL